MQFTAGVKAAKLLKLSSIFKENKQRCECQIPAITSYLLLITHHSLSQRSQIFMLQYLYYFIFSSSSSSSALSTTNFMTKDFKHFKVNYYCMCAFNFSLSVNSDACFLTNWNKNHLTHEKYVLSKCIERLYGSLDPTNAKWLFLFDNEFNHTQRQAAQNLKIDHGSTDWYSWEMFLFVFLCNDKNNKRRNKELNIFATSQNARKKLHFQFNKNK